MNNKKIILATLLIIFAISCSNDDKTGSGGGGGGTDLADAIYSGKLNLKSKEGQGAASITPEDPKDYTITISGGNHVQLENAPINKSGSEYYATQNIPDTDGSSETTYYDKFTISADGNTLNVMEHSITVEMSGVIVYKWIYTGTLTKQ